MKQYKAILAGLAMLIGAMALLRSDWTIAAYWFAVEIYWGLGSVEETEGDRKEQDE